MSERDSGIALLRAMARAHRALAEHNEEGPEGWRKEVVDLATGTRTVADDFDAIAERLLAAEARAVRCEGERDRGIRARAAAIASLARRDVLGAMAALTMSRDHPELFDCSTFEDAPPVKKYL